MQRSTRALIATVGLTLPLANLTAADGVPYKVIVNSSRGAASLSRAQVADYLLKRVSKWPDGTAVTAVDLSATSPTRSAFSKDVLGKSIDAVVHYWQQQIFAGRGAPPPVKSEAEVLALVASLPGAIGYVGAEVPLPPGIGVLTLKD